jgi:hypothetical protein
MSHWIDYYASLGTRGRDMLKSYNQKGKGYKHGHVVQQIRREIRALFSLSDTSPTTREVYYLDCKEIYNIFSNE